jgi:hypothetical protein
MFNKHLLNEWMKNPGLKIKTVYLGKQPVSQIFAISTIISLSKCLLSDDIEYIFYLS